MRPRVRFAGLVLVSAYQWARSVTDTATRLVFWAALLAVPEIAGIGAWAKHWVPGWVTFVWPVAFVLVAIGEGAYRVAATGIANPLSAPAIPRRPLAQVKREGLALHNDYFQEITDRDRGKPSSRAGTSSSLTRQWEQGVKYRQETDNRLRQKFALKIIALHADLAAYGYKDPELDEKMAHAGHFLSDESWMRELVMRVSGLCERIPD